MDIKDILGSTDIKDIIGRILNKVLGMDITDIIGRILNIFSDGY